MEFKTKITVKEAARINECLRKARDSSHPIRRSEDGEAFWDVAFSRLDATDASGSSDLMYEA